MASFFLKKLTQGLGSLLKKSPKKEELPTKVDDIDITDAPPSSDLVPLEIQKEQVDAEELKRIGKIKKDAAELKFATERAPLKKIIPKDPTYIEKNEDFFKRGLVEDFDKNTTSILPRSSVLREQIIAHPSNEPLSAREWVKWIKRRMNKSVNYSDNASLNKMDLSIKQTEIDDANLFKTRSQFNQEILRALEVGDDPELIFAIDRFRQRRGKKVADEYFAKIKKDLEVERATGKEELVGGYLKALEDAGKKISKQQLVKIVENNPLYHGRLTHLAYDDKKENILENSLGKLENEYLIVQKVMDEVNNKIDDFVKTYKDFQMIETKDALGKTVKGYTKPNSKKLKDEIQLYQSQLKKLSNQISVVDVKAKYMLQDPMGSAGTTIIDNMYKNKLRKKLGSRIDTDLDNVSGVAARGIAQDMIDVLKRQENRIERIAELNGSSYPIEIVQGAEMFGKSLRKLREVEEKTIKKYLEDSKSKLFPGYRNYTSYVIGGENKYGEIVFNIPEHNKKFMNALENSHRHMGVEHLSSTNVKVPKAMIGGGKSDKGGNFKTFGGGAEEYTRLQVNPVYFSRYTVQKLDNGDSVLMINELQSDFGQKLRELKERGVERINPFNTEFFSGPAEQGIFANQKLQDIKKRISDLDAIRSDQGLLTNTQSNEYKKLLLDALVEEKKYAKGFSGMQSDVLSQYKEIQERNFPYLPLSSMQGVSDHAIKTYSKLASKDMPEVTHIAVYPVEMLHGRKRGLDKAPNWIQYGSQEGKAGYVKSGDRKIGLPDKKSTLHKAMEKFAKDYGVKLETRLVSRSDPDKPYKLVIGEGDGGINTDIFPKMKGYQEHFAAFATQKEAIRALRLMRKFDRDINLEVIEKLKNGKPNPKLYDEMVTLPIPTDMLNLPTKGYFKGGLVRSGFKW